MMEGKDREKHVMREEEYHNFIDILHSPFGALESSGETDMRNMDTQRRACLAPWAISLTCQANNLNTYQSKDLPANP